jgi:spore germination protein YaaH
MTPRLIALILAFAVAGGETAAARPLMIGFYLPWDAASRAAVVRRAGELDVLAPMSGALDSAAGTVRWQDDPARGPALAAARTKPKVFPVVSNAHDEVWDATAADGALTDDRAGQAFIDALTTAAKAQGYGGYILDLENLSARAAPAYAPFLVRLRAALRPLGRELWVTTSLGADPAMIQALDAATDGVVLMAYDQCWATGTPGPIAGQDWLERNLDMRLSASAPNRYIVALGAYGYNWAQGAPAAVISASDAAELARSTGHQVSREPPAANPHFNYAGPDGRPHTVWYLDAATFRAQRAAAEARHARGVAIWRLGLEDPAIWVKAPATRSPIGPAVAPPPCVALPAPAR